MGEFRATAIVNRRPCRWRLDWVRLGGTCGSIHSKKRLCYIASPHMSHASARSVANMRIAQPFTMRARGPFSLMLPNCRVTKWMSPPSQYQCAVHNATESRCITFRRLSSSPRSPGGITCSYMRRVTTSRGVPHHPNCSVFVNTSAIIGLMRGIRDEPTRADPLSHRVVIA